MSKKRAPIPPTPLGLNKRTAKELDDMKAVMLKLIEQNNGHVEKWEEVIEEQAALGRRISKVITLLKGLPALELKHDLSALATPSIQALDENFDAIRTWGNQVATAIKELEA